MAIKGPNPDNMIKMLIIGLVFMVLITSIIDFSAVNSDDPNAKIFRSDISYETLAPPVYIALIAGMAVYMAYTLTLGAQGRFDKKKLLTLVVLGVILYFIYQKVLVGLVPGLPSIEFAAYQLQSVVGP